MVGFALMYVVFDEEEGPVAKRIKMHDLTFPKVILRGACTSLFSMAVGIGEPEGDHETAIIPLSITQARGRVFIYSFGLEDKAVRGGKRIESFMLFIERKFQDRLINRLSTIMTVFKEAVTIVTAQKNLAKVFEDTYNRLRQILHTEIDPYIQTRISNLCSDTEIATVYDTTLKAIVNTEITPTVTDLLHIIRSDMEEIKILREELTRRQDDELLKSVYGSDRTLFSSYLELHGKAKDNITVFGLYKNARFSAVISSKRGTTGRLLKPIHEINDLATEQKEKIIDFEIITLEKYFEDELDLNNATEFLTEPSTANEPPSDLQNYSDLLQNMETEFLNSQIFSVTNQTLNYSHAKIDHSLVKVLYLKYLGIFKHIQEYVKNLANTDIEEIIFTDQNLVKTMVYNFNRQGRNYYFIGESKKNIGYLRLLKKDITA